MRPPPPFTSRLSAPRPGGITPAACAALALLLPGGLAAQIPELPTLSDAGLEYVSQSGFLQAFVSGRLDLEALRVGDSWAGLIDHEGGEDPLPEPQAPCARCHVGMAFPGEGGTLPVHRLRIFADLFLGEHLYSLVELRSDRGHAPSDRSVEARVEQAFVRVSTATGSAGVQAGRFASPFGAYPMRHLTPVDPFIRPPLPYDYRTVMNRRVVPGDADLLLRWKDVPQFFRKPGVPPVWEVPYQWGAMAFGGLGPVDLRVAAMNSAPSSGPESWGFELDRFDDPSWVVALRARPTASVDLGISWNRGPWMEEPDAGTIRPPPDAGPDAEAPGWRDFDQELISVDVGFARGPLMARAEAILDRWEVPNVQDRPTEIAYSLELQSDLVAGLFVAARGGYVDFRPLDDGLGEASPRPGGEATWDHDVYRWEGALGYRLSRNVGVLLSAYRQAQAGAEDDGDTDFAGIRLWYAF